MAVDMLQPGQTRRPGREFQRRYGVAAAADNGLLADVLGYIEARKP